MEESKIVDKFDPKKSELQAIVEETKNITVTDLEDPEQLKIVTENRIKIKKARVLIEKAGKAARDESNAYSKAVIAYEKSLIEIIQPEEDRLAEIEEQAKKISERKERMERLPARKDRLLAIGVTTGDDFLLEMDSASFEDYFNTKTAEMLDAREKRLRFEQEERDRIASEEQVEKQKLIDAENGRRQKELDEKQAVIDAKEKVLNAEALRVEKEKQDALRIEEAKLEGEKKAIKDAEDREKKRIADEKAQADAEELKRIREEDDKRIHLEKLQKKEAYTKFLKDSGWTSETRADFKTEETEEGYVLWKRVGTFLN